MTYSAVLRTLHNPRYAGAFCFGRHRDLTGPDGKTRHTTLTPRQEWISFIPGAHPGDITLAEFDATQARLAECAAAHGAERRSGPAREGPAPLRLIICGTCGQRMTVRYHLRSGQQLPDYVCQKAMIEHAGQLCQSVPGDGLDTAIGQLLIETLTPLAIETALTVTAELEHRAEAADQLRAATAERARYHAELARRRYLAVDPTNRLVADTLEADWNTALRELGDAQDAYDEAHQTATGTLTEAHRSSRC